MNTPNNFHPALKYLIDCRNIHIPAEKIYTKVIHNGQEVDVAAENKKTLNVLIKNLKTETDRSIQEKVKVSTSRFTLITGNNLYLLEAIEAYIYCIHAKTSLYLYDLAGKTPEKIKEVLYGDYTYSDSEDKIKNGNVIDQLKNGVTVFLNNLECQDSLILKDLSKEIRNVKANTGMLVITSLNNISTLPEYFTNLFDVVNLEPEKQEQSNGQSIPVEINIFHKEGNLWTIQFNGKTTRINHYIGLSYIACLIENKDQDFYVHEIIQAVNKEKFQSIKNGVKSRLAHQDDDNEELDIVNNN